MKSVFTPATTKQAHLLKLTTALVGWRDSTSSTVALVRAQSDIQHRQASSRRTTWGKTKEHKTKNYD